MALQTITELSEIDLLDLPNAGVSEIDLLTLGGDRTLSTFSSVETVVHVSDGPDEQRMRTSGHLPDDTFGRLAFAVFDMRRPRRKWIPLLKKDGYMIIFMASLEYYTKRRPEYLFVWENVLLSGEVSQRICVYAMKELRAQSIMKRNAVMGRT